MSVSSRNVRHQGSCDAHELKVCTQYLGSLDESSNMALMEIDFISGHEADKETIMVCCKNDPSVYVVDIPYFIEEEPARGNQTIRSEQREACLVF